MIHRDYTNLLAVALLTGFLVALIGVALFYGGRP